MRIATFLILSVLTACTGGSGELLQAESCVTAGCSAELCVLESDSDIASTCAMNCEDLCLEHASCVKAEGQCGWEIDDDVAYDDCIASCVM